MKVRACLGGLTLVCLVSPGHAAPGDAPALTAEQRLQVVERRAERVTDLTLQVEALKRENRELRGEIENLHNEMRQLRRRQRDIYMDIDQRLSGLAAAAPAAPSTPVTAAPPAAAEQLPAPVAPARPAAPRPPEPVAAPVAPTVAAGPDVPDATVRAEYQAAYSLLSPQTRRYDEAITQFKAFLAKYPNHGLAANARYWLGEAYYVSQDNPAALKAFEALVATNPDSPKVPGALYKVGRIQHVQGDNAAARTTLQGVIDKYPAAPAAGLARQYLQQVPRAN